MGYHPPPHPVDHVSSPISPELVELTATRLEQLGLSGAAQRSLTGSGMSLAFPWPTHSLKTLGARERRYLRWLSEKYRKRSFRKTSAPVLVLALMGQSPFPRKASSTARLGAKFGYVKTPTTGPNKGRLRYSNRSIRTSSSGKSKVGILQRKMI